MAEGEGGEAQRDPDESAPPVSGAEKDARVFEEIDRRPKSVTPNLTQDEEDQKKDRELRAKFMLWMTLVLVFQLTFVNGTILGLAIPGIIKVEEWTLRLWIGGTLLEVFGIVLVIAQYLFPKRRGKTLTP